MKTAKVKQESVLLVYSARIKREDGKYVVTFRDIDGAITEGDTVEEAVFNASEALDGVLAVMMDNGFDIPVPTTPRKGEYQIPVGLTVSAPLSLYMLRKRLNMTQAEVARRLKVTYQGYQQMERPGANITARRLQEAAAALGAVVELKFVPTSKLAVA